MITISFPKKNITLSIPTPKKGVYPLLLNLDNSIQYVEAVGGRKLLSAVIELPKGLKFEGVCSDVQTQPVVFSLKKDIVLKGDYYDIFELFHYPLAALLVFKDRNIHPELIEAVEKYFHLEKGDVSEVLALAKEGIMYCDDDKTIDEKELLEETTRLLTDVKITEKVSVPTKASKRRAA